MSLRRHVLVNSRDAPFGQIVYHKEGLQALRHRSVVGIDAPRYIRKVDLIDLYS